MHIALKLAYIYSYSFLVHERWHYISSSIDVIHSAQKLLNMHCTNRRIDKWGHRLLLWRTKSMVIHILKHVLPHPWWARFSRKLDIFRSVQDFVFLREVKKNVNNNHFHSITRWTSTVQGKYRYLNIDKSITRVYFDKKKIAKICTHKNISMLFLCWGKCPSNCKPTTFFNFM